MDCITYPIFLFCPHCDLLMEIEKLNCCIFRHGIIIKTNEQIPPHSNKITCDHLISNNLIIGCGKPFKIIKINDNEYSAIKCDYI